MATLPDAKAIGLDGVSVWGSLYQGACPPAGRSLGEAGFRALVICSREICDSLRGDDYPGVLVHRCPLLDELAPVTTDMWKKIDEATGFVFTVRYGPHPILGSYSYAPTLVACQQGKNRSALVAAAAIMRISGCSGTYAVDALRKVSRRVFSNEHFAESLVRRRPGNYGPTGPTG